MTFLVITEAQKLIREVGGEFKAGDKLKNYWYAVCENLSIYADVGVQPRTIENLWRTGSAGQELIDALKKTAEGINYKKQKGLNDYDARFILQLKASHEALKQDKLFPRAEAAVLGGVIRLLEEIAKQRFAIQERFSAEDRALDIIRNCCQVSRAIIAEAESEAAE